MPPSSPPPSDGTNPGPTGERSDAPPDEVRIRPTGPQDAAALLAHLRALPEQDRRRRFFGPADLDTHVRRWLELDDVVSLVAVTPDGQVVGEAGAAPWGEQAAEFAISVATDRRGGLGRRLLEQLCEHAAARGITLLYGEVYADNQPMIRLMQRLGAVTIDQPGRGVLGLVLATDGQVPGWRDTSRPRVLVEAPGGTWSGVRALRDAGVEVTVCAGPTTRAEHSPCPVLEARPCPLVEDADLVVHALDAEVAPNAALAMRLGIAHGTTGSGTGAAPGTGSPPAADGGESEAAPAVRIWRTRGVPDAQAVLGRLRGQVDRASEELGGAGAGAG